MTFSTGFYSSRYSDPRRVADLSRNSLAAVFKDLGEGKYSLEEIDPTKWDQENYERLSLAAVTRDGLQLEYVHADYLSDQGNQKVERAAVMENIEALKFANIENFSVGFLCEALKQQEEYLSKVMELIDSSDYDQQICDKLALAIVTEDGLALKYIDLSKLSEDGRTDAIKEAVRQNGYTLELTGGRELSTEFLSSIMEEQCGQFPGLLDFIEPDELEEGRVGYEQIVKVAVRANKEAIIHIKAQGCNYQALAMEFVKEDWKALKYIEAEDCQEYDTLIRAVVVENLGAGPYLESTEGDFDRFAKELIKENPRAANSFQRWSQRCPEDLTAIRGAKRRKIEPGSLDETEVF
jgi:hypothetical protein